jgi:hypothetical protein
VWVLLARMTAMVLKDATSPAWPAGEMLGQRVPLCVHASSWAQRPIVSAELQKCLWHQIPSGSIFLLEQRTHPMDAATAAHGYFDTNNMSR